MSRGMSGVFGEMSGEDWRAFGRAYLALALFTFATTTVNIFTVMHDRAADGHPVPAIAPVIWEYTSAVSILVFAGVIYAALRLAPPLKGEWLRFALVHLPATVLFSALHVSLMVLERMALYATVGRRYCMALSEFPYEYRKDVLAYVLAGGLFWMSARLAEGGRGVGAVDPAMFIIRDGARIIRARVQDIVSASSAGNYVEFALADGRKPLMRCTLASVETALEPHGFVRTHRSWLVNAARVEGLKPDGSGDFTVKLDTGAEIPLSRRFPQGHRRLRPPAG